MKSYRKVICETFVPAGYIDSGWAETSVWVEVSGLRNACSQNEAIKGAREHFRWTEATAVEILTVGPEVPSLPSKNTWCVDVDGECVNVADAS